MLGKLLDKEHQTDSAAAILAALSDQPTGEIRPYLEAVIRDRLHHQANRLTALALFVRGLDPADSSALLRLAVAVEDGPVLADVLRRSGMYPKIALNPILNSKLRSPNAEVRAAAIEALGERRAAEAA